MGKKKQEAGAPGWIVTFADLMSLLLTFFVLLLSFAETDVKKFKSAAGSLKHAFGVQSESYMFYDTPLSSTPFTNSHAQGNKSAHDFNFEESPLSLELNSFCSLRQQYEAQDRMDLKLMGEEIAVQLKDAKLSVFSQVLIEEDLVRIKLKFDDFFSSPKDYKVARSSQSFLDTIFSIVDNQRELEPKLVFTSISPTQLDDRNSGQWKISNLRLMGLLETAKLGPYDSLKGSTLRDQATTKSRDFGKFFYLDLSI